MSVQVIQEVVLNHGINHYDLKIFGKIEHIKEFSQNNEYIGSLINYSIITKNQPFYELYYTTSDCAYDKPLTKTEDPEIRVITLAENNLNLRFTLTKFTNIKRCDPKVIKGVNYRIIDNSKSRIQKFNSCNS